MGCAKWGSQGRAVIGPIGPRRNNFLMPLIQLGLFRLDFLRLSRLLSNLGFTGKGTANG